MFEILFGWRKASKCKKLIRRVQCRLKLLKNKRCSIVRQLREDVAQLLKYGHDQSAFDRVEHLFKDESIVTVYELLDHFCEFILIHLSYIRRHKDCPNDINEAVSSLIFASARCGDLPELPVIRKLFGERYGQRFAVVALELLPGNLVNRQIRENLSIKSVSNEVKYKLLDEIARSCLPIAPLALEYHPEQQEHLTADQSNGDQVPNIDVQTSYKKYEESQIVEEGKIVQVDFSSEENKLSTSPRTCPNTVDSSTHNRFKEGAMDEDSSSESSYHMPEEMIYLDDIEEFQSPMSKDGKDQRVFVFKSTVIPTREEIYVESLEEKSGSRSYRKCGKENGKRLRRESFSWERNISNIECALYYNETCVPNGNIKSNHPRKHHKKEIEGNRKKCSLDRPYYACVSGSLNGELNNKKISDNLICVSKEFESETRDCLGNWGSACSKQASPMEMKESKHPCLRAVTMPIERTKDSESDNILRSNSFPIKCSSPHVHPKLPDYDELAAKFMALKKSNLQNKRI